MIEKVTPAQLVWGEDNLPRSQEFGDLYFSADNGLEETNHVFLEGNNLRSRWKELNAGSLFVIVETGFGSGLNLLEAAKLWQQIAPENARLQFISIEKHPMRRNDLLKTHQHTGSPKPLAMQLIDMYPPLTPGAHRFDLLKNLEVTLLFDDIESGLRSLCAPLEPKLWEHKPYSVDAWFLDGFAPAKNPQMWQPSLFPLMHRLSQVGTTAATFTAAGDVRRSLQHWGFNVVKTPGYGRKREMLVATYEAKPQDLNEVKPSHKSPIVCWTLPEPPIKVPESPIAIIGGGIAGTTLASALAKRGKPVHIFEAQAKPAAGASGISQVALYARLSPDPGELEDFMLSAMPFSHRYYKKLLENADASDLGELCGLIQLPRNDNELRKMEQVSARFHECPELVQFTNAEALSKIAGVPIKSSGLFFPGSGWLNGTEVCSQLIKHPNISAQYDKKLEKLSRTNNQWLLEFSDGKAESYESVVLCTANAAKEFHQLGWLPTRPIRGQVSLFAPPESIQNLSVVICRETQLTPGQKGRFCTGSTYGLDEVDTDIREEDHQKNSDKLQHMIGSQLNQTLESFEGQAGVRCSTPDYLPMVGTVPRFESFINRYSDLRKDAKSQLPYAGPVEPGLFVNLGYGSRGYTYAPLCAEKLASQMCGEIPPLPEALRRAINPARFLIRGLIRGKY